MPFMKIRDGRMHYEVLGEGPPVLLVHGFTNFGLVWGDQAMALVYAGYKVIMPDLAGHGLSSPATEDTPVATLAADMVALLDHLDVAKASVCGLSLGGMVVQELMAEHRNRVVAGIVVDSCADASSEKNVAAVTEWIRMFRQPDGQMIRQEAAWPHLLQAPFRESPTGHSFNATWRNILRNVPGTSLAHVAIALMTFSIRQRLPGVTTPCLVINGEHDKLFPVDMCKEIADLIPGAEFALIAGGGHISALDSPMPFNELLLGFLRKHAPVA
jgi:3-oxoadipate enol-lactonase